MVLARLLIATSVSWYHHSDLKTQIPVLEKLVTFLRMDEGKNNIKNYNGLLPQSLDITRGGTR